MKKNHFTISTVFIFLAINFYGFSSEFIDIASCMEQRTQQYPINGYDRVYVTSPYRTGSTYVYNILRFLFENEEVKNHPHSHKDQSKRKVLKFHGLFKKTENPLVVFTIRNPLDACFSLYRVNSSIEKKKKIDDDYILYIVDQQMLFWYNCAALILEGNKNNLMLLRFEDFNNNIDHIFEKIESFLPIKIEEQDKALLKNALDRENVKANIKQLNKFDQFDQNSLLHGQHIESDAITEEERVRICGIIFEELKKKHKPIIEKWGYSYIFDE